MAPSRTPRQIAKGLLKGDISQQPLFLPIVFSIGSRIENVPLRDFLQNPTKISSSLKQIRNFLRCDGLACYFDPYLEAEALGGELRWSGEDLCQLILSSISETPDFRQRLCAPEEVARKGRSPVAIDVIRRLKLMLREESVLMAGVTGPCTLSSRLLGLEMGEVRERGHVSAPAAEFAAEATGQMAAKFVEAGADVIFIVEEALPVFSAEAFDDWVSLLVPVLNVIRFYEALPVLLLTDSRSVASNWERLFNQRWDCVLCPAMVGLEMGILSEIARSKGTLLGMALPLELFHLHHSNRDSLLQTIRDIFRDLRPVLLTTGGDIPATTDMKHLSETIQLVRHLAKDAIQGKAPEGSAQ